MDTEKLRKLWKEAFGDEDAFLNAFFGAAYSPDRCRTIDRDGQPAAMLYWFDCELQGEKLAYLYAVATAKAYRGRGLCHELMEKTHRELAEQGYRGAVLVPGEESLFRFYKTMGYLAFGPMEEFTCVPGPRAAELTQLTPNEYAARRRKLLPDGGVIQEKENLAFLQTQGSLYAGPDFLLAARRVETTLQGLELLGNKAAAPSILRALDCETGTFRTPGGNKHFAMYRPLRPRPAPAYFGLAFD